MLHTDPLDDLRRGEPIFWRNDGCIPFADIAVLELTADDIADASRRLDRFAPLIAEAFPETRPLGGIIESPLREISAMRTAMGRCGDIPDGRLLIKLDSHLAIAGSVKARGGIYEVLRHTEDIAVREGLLDGGDHASLLRHRDVFARRTIQVGSTGNLGLSIGISAAALGYRAVVHMSSDAKQWKKDLLRRKGVDVREYSGDYSAAVAQGRALSDADPASYFVDDENSADLFLGYAVAGERLSRQLSDMGVTVDGDHPLYVYLPCGVGGAPGGITFGLRHIFGDSVHCFFVEPTLAPCCAAALLSGRGSDISIGDLGLSGRTEADGLAVGRASALVCRMMRPMLSGCFTAPDDVLLPYLRLLYSSEDIFIEPSSCIAFDAYRRASAFAHPGATHLIWATGGSLVPDDVRREYLGG